MLGELLSNLITGVYFLCAFFLLMYGLNCYHAVYIFLKHYRKKSSEDEQFLESIPDDYDWPMVTTQLPVFNEINCVERLINAICNLDYPKDKHFIQVLDDSTDDCYLLTQKLVAQKKEKGFLIELIHRTDRTDYKAGALKLGMESAQGEYLSIFDADFIPQRDFLKKTVPFLDENPKLALVQTRWGHINRYQSVLTLAQSIGIDGHFVIEQSARNWGGFFMNFNGTAGIWRKESIIDAGNWEGDTLTEDMDLSYRAQLNGWEMKFLFNVVVPAELPEDINAFKSQQFRWAKGSIQTAMKLFPRILISDTPKWLKFQAFMHLTHYMIHPLMITTALLSYPILMTQDMKFGDHIVLIGLILILISAMAPSVLYVVAQRFGERQKWLKRLFFLPALICVGVGIAVNNTKAVLSAVFNNKSSHFIRTPKSGVKKTTYKVPFPLFSFLELILGLYCFYSFTVYIHSHKYLVGPFLVLYACGFMVVGFMSMFHFLRTR